MTKIDEHIEAYLSGNISKEDSEELLLWINESESNKNEFSEACRLWYSLNSNKYNSQKAFAKFTDKTSKKIIPLWKRVCAVAAVAILAIGCFSIFTRTENITITNNDLAVKCVSLPDNSVVYLQKDATITYPEKFKRNSRNITANGNFFCEITPNKKAPFEISSKDISITVLGTSFHVNTTDSTYVIVETGKVNVSNKKQSVVIEKGERADLKNENIIASTNTDINFLSWKTKLLQFRNTPITQVFRDLSRCYMYSFDTTNTISDLSKIELTGTYQNLSLEETLKLIEIAIPDFHYEIKNNTVSVLEADRK